MKSWRITADKFLSRGQIDALLMHITNRRDLAFARNNDHQAIKDYYIVRGLLESGLRVFEFCSILNGDFHGHKLAVTRGKGGKARTVLLTRGTANLLNEWLLVKRRLEMELSPSAPMFPSRYGTAYTTRGVQKRIELIFDSLGFPETLTTHNLRHTYCSLLLESGKVGLPTVKENMGHSTIATTNLYAHATGNLDEIDLFASSTSHNFNNSEPQASPKGKKVNTSIASFLGNTNLKPGHLKNRKNDSRN